MKKENQCCRTGLGFDSHAFSTTGTLMLGGVEFEGVPALKGHSDGDALLHAVTDALLGGAGLGDIGEFFPDTDNKLKGISSRVLLQRAVGHVRKKGWVPSFVDATVVCERPRLSKRKDEIKKRLAKDTGLPASSINIKAKTPEGLTWFPESGGVAVWAVAQIRKKAGEK